MSKFYGSVTTDKGVSTRAGHRYVVATAQSYDGSISVSIDAAGKVIICAGEGSQPVPVFPVWSGTLRDIIDSGHLSATVCGNCLDDDLRP